MKKLIFLLLVISTIQGMEQPSEAQKLLAEVRKNNTLSQRQIALEFVDGKEDESTFLYLIAYDKEKQTPRVASLLGIKQACIDAMQNGDPAEVEQSIDALLAARANLSYRESWHFWLSRAHRYAVEFVQKPSRTFDYHQVYKIFTTRKDLTAPQIQKIIQQIRRVAPEIDASIKGALCITENLVRFENYAVLQGLVQAEIIDAKALYTRLNHVMAKTFVDHNPDVACEDELLALSLKIDAVVCQGKIRKYFGVDPTISKEQHEMAQRFNALKTSESIHNIKALRESMYACLKQKEAQGSTLKPLCFWLHKYIASPYVSDKSYPITQIEWFVYKDGCDLSWYCDEQGPYFLTTPLDLLLEKRRHAKDILEHVSLLLKNNGTCKQDHQKKLETDVNRLGRCGQQYDGLVTAEERVAAKETSKYKRAAELLALLYPQSEFTDILIKSKMII